MEREIVTAGTKISLATLFENLQNDIQLNTFRDFAQFIDTYGVNCDVISGIVPTDDESLKLVAGSLNTQFSVKGGTGLTEAFNYIDIPDGDPYATNIDPTQTSTTLTVYVKYVGETYNNAEVVNGFLYGDLTSVAKTREHASYEIAYTDPGISGLILGQIVLDGSGVITTITDLRHTNALKLKHSVFPDTVVKTDRDSHVYGTLTGNIIGASSGGTGLLIENEGMLSEETITTSGLNESYNWRHDHSVDVTMGSRTVLDSENAVTAHSELHNLFRHGIINYQDGDGDRVILTQKIPSVPNAPSPSVTLREQIPDSIATQKLTDYIRSYSVKQISMAENINAYTAVADWRSTIEAYQIAHPTWTCADLYVVSGIMTLASGLWAEGYAYDVSGPVSTAAGYYNDGITTLGMKVSPTSQSVSAALSVIDTTLQYITDYYNSLNADIAIIGNQILQNDASIRVTPNQIARQYEALIYWSQPTLVDNEAIIKYQVRAYRLIRENSTPTTPSLTTLLTSYISDIITDISADTNTAGVTLTAHGNTTAAGAVSNSAVINVNSTTGFEVGQLVKITRAAVTIASGVIQSIGSGTITLYSAITCANEDSVISYSQDYESLSNYTIGGTARTTYAIPIEPNQTWIVFVRSVSEYGIVSAWSNGLKFETNDLVSGSGSALSDIVAEDQSFVAQAQSVVRSELKRDFETQLTALQQQMAALPTQTQVTNVISALTELTNTVAAMS